MELHESGVFLPKNYNIFVKPSLYDITNRQYDQYKETSEFLQWGRRNPTLFASEIFGVELMDYQTYVFMNTWTTKNVVWCMSRNGGKSALAALYLMTKSLLVPNFTAYILCGVGSQSIEMYQKLEKIVKDEVPSFTTLTSVYSSEIIKSAANKDGFVHNPASYHHKLYNDAQIFTLNGAYNNNRSKEIPGTICFLVLEQFDLDKTKNHRLPKIRLLPQSEMIGFPNGCNLSEKETGKAEMLIRMEGFI